VSALLLGALVGCARPTPAAAYARAVAPSTPFDEAVALCGDAGPSAEECVAVVVRAHADAPGADEACDALREARWRGECHFSLAERRAADGDRWAALRSCASAGPYYDECLYHAWTLELQHIAAAGEPRGAAARLPDARDAIAFWSEVQTVGGSALPMGARGPSGSANQPDGAPAQIEHDWWFFAHARNRPARRADCASLEQAPEREGCERGTRLFVRRSVVEGLARDAGRARVCRGGADAARDVLGALYASPDAELDAVYEAAVAEACAAALHGARPWNPSFRPRRASAPAAGPDASPSAHGRAPGAPAGASFP
jgi:hypothetical protein